MYKGQTALEYELHAATRLASFLFILLLFSTDDSFIIISSFLP